MRPALRRGIERQILINVAGELGGHLLEGPTTGFSAPNVDEERALRLSELVGLTSREEAALAGWEHEGVEETDAARAS